MKESVHKSAHENDRHNQRETGQETGATKLRQTEQLLAIDRFFGKREQQAQDIIKWMRRMEQMDVAIESWKDDPADVMGRKHNDTVIFEEVLMKDITHLPKEVYDAFKSAWFAWAQRVRNATRVLKTIKETSSIADEKEVDPSRLGRVMFESRVGMAAEGEVRFYQKGPTYFFSFENISDYNKILQALSGYESGEEGAYHIARAFWKQSFIPTTLQKGLVPHQQLLSHEGQHFLNQSLGDLFKRWEGDQQEDLPLTKCYREIKDEALAYLRDGHSPEQIYDTLTQNSLYQHLYRGLTSDQITAVKEMLLSIKTALEDHVWTAKSPTLQDEFIQHKRELMVASLIDVPLPKMAKYIRASSEYYKKKIAGMTPPPRPLRREATVEQKREWQEKQRTFVDRYNQLMGFLPEYGVPTPEAEEERSNMYFIEERLNGPPPRLVSDTPEGRAAYQERINAWKQEKERVKNWHAREARAKNTRLDEI
jgi:hypothetical protein